MAEREGAHPIKKSDLEKHFSKVDEHMTSINRGGIERPNLFDLLKDVGGDKYVTPKEVSDTISTLREGFGLYYEMYATLEEFIERVGIDGNVEKRERINFLSAYSMFAASSFVAHQFSLLTEEEPLAIQRREGFFRFDLTKDDTLNDVLSRYYGAVNSGKRNEVIAKGSDLPRMSIDFFKFLRDEALSKKTTFHKELVDLVSRSNFTIDNKFTITGFETSYEEEKKKEKIEIVPVEPYQVAGNVLAKQEMLRDMDRIALFSLEDKKNPIIELGGLSWSVLYDGLPGTGKDTLFKMGLTRLSRRIEQVNALLVAADKKQIAWQKIDIDQGIKDEYYGKTGTNLIEKLEPTKRPEGIYIVLMNDIDLLVSGDRNSSSGGSDKDIMNILMQYADSVNTVIRGNVQLWAATNDATAMDPALRQRFVARYEVNGPQEWYDFADILNNKLKSWLQAGIVKVPMGEGYEPFEMRKNGSGAASEERTLLKKITGRFKKGISMKDIGELCKEMKDKNPRFTGRAVHAVSEAIKKRINNYEIPEEWYTNPDKFLYKDYKTRVEMLKGLCGSVSGEIIVEEFERYFESEQRYAADKFESDVARNMHNIRVELESRSRMAKELGGRK